MPSLNEEQWATLVANLRELEALADSLHRRVGDEACVEFHERMKELKRVLALDEWR